MRRAGIVEKERIFGDWCSFYEKCFDIGIDDINPFKKNPSRGDLKRLTIIAKDITYKKAQAEYLKKFSCCIPDEDLDEVVTLNERDPKNGTYAILSRNGREADKIYKNISAETMWKKKKLGMTLLERMIYGLKYHSETGRHLDVDYWTYCTGSRKKDGSVIIVGNCGKTDFEIRSVKADMSSIDWRAREIILL